MIRRCTGEDPNLVMYVDPSTGKRVGGKIREIGARPSDLDAIGNPDHDAGDEDDGAHAIGVIGKPCDCGRVFDDEKRSTIFPHAPV